jgi:hypothetical protein
MKRPIENNSGEAGVAATPGQPWRSRAEARNCFNGRVHYVGGGVDIERSELCSFRGTDAANFRSADLKPAQKSVQLSGLPVERVLPYSSLLLL